MHCEFKRVGATSVISPAGDFVFDGHRDFRQVTELALGQGDAADILIDLASVNYLDSSALGMLLLFKEKADALGKRVRIAGARGVVRQVLEVANFHTRFEISN